MVAGEFFGTGALALAVLAMSNSNISQMPYFVAMGAGLVLAALVVMLANVTGAVFNPALSLGLWTVRKLQNFQTLAYIVAQFAGAAAAYMLFCWMVGIPLDKLENKGLTTMNSKIMVGELLGTLVFSMAIASALYQNLSLGVKAFIVGAGLSVGALLASLASGGLLNPAVALSVHQFGLWTYVLGPVLGAVLGFNLYNWLFVDNEVAASRPATTTLKTVAVKPAVTARKTTTKKAVATKKKTVKK